MYSGLSIEEDGVRNCKLEILRREGGSSREAGILTVSTGVEDRRYGVGYQIGVCAMIVDCEA